MIVDVRTYNIVPRKMPRYLELFETYALPVQLRHIGAPLGLRPARALDPSPPTGAGDSED